MAIPAPADPLERVYLLFQSAVNQQSSERLCTAMSQLSNQGYKEIYMLLSTPGGQVSNGIAIYNFMRGLPCKFVTHNIGNVDSIGNVVFLGGEERYACAAGTFMFHGVGFDMQAMRFEAKNLKQMSDGIKREHQRIGDIIGQRSKLDARQIAKLFLEARTENADFAVNKGLAHGIRELQIEPGRQIVSLAG